MLPDVNWGMIGGSIAALRDRDTIPGAYQSTHHGHSIHTGHYCQIARLWASTADVLPKA
jgi:hypothetical protein